MKPYGYPRGKGDPKSERPKARKRRARATVTRDVTEHLAGELHPAELRLIDHDAGGCKLCTSR